MAALACRAQRYPPRSDKLAQERGRQISWPRAFFGRAPGRTPQQWEEPMTAEPADQLSTALEATQRVLAQVRDDQWTAPTPCTRWNVRDLVEHVVLGNFLYAHILHGQPPAARDELLTPGRDLLDAYRDSATAVVGAF